MFFQILTKKISPPATNLYFSFIFGSNNTLSPKIKHKTHGSNDTVSVFSSFYQEFEDSLKI